MEKTAVKLVCDKFPSPSGDYLI